MPRDSNRVKTNKHFNCFLIGYLAAGLIVYQLGDSFSPSGFWITVGAAAIVAGLSVGVSVTRFGSFAILGGILGSVCVYGFKLVGSVPGNGLDPQIVGAISWGVIGSLLGIARVVSEFARSSYDYRY